MHFTDAFIQSDLQCIQVIHFVSMCVPWKLNPQPFVLLTQCSTTEPQEHLLVYLKSFLFIIMVELDHQRSAANTLVNKMRLDIFMLFNIFNYCRFVPYSEFAFHCFNSFL